MATSRSSRSKPMPEWVIQDLAGATGAGVTVGVIDSGWYRPVAHPRVSDGVSFVDAENEFVPCFSEDDNDRIGHGSACSDIILRVSPDATIVPIRVFGRRLETSPEVLAAAIRWAADERLPIVNLSLGTFRVDAMRLLYAACDKARESGVILVAASHAKRVWNYPAVFENVIGVAGGNFTTPFEYRYRRDHAVECQAKARHQRVQGIGYCRNVSGTSFAAPSISGILALVYQRNPNLDIDAARIALERYAVA